MSEVKVSVIELSPGVHLYNATPEYFKSFVEMCGKMPVIEHSKSAYSHKYTPLKDIKQIADPIAASFGFAIDQRIDDVDGQWIVTTLNHVSGAFKVSRSKYIVEDYKGQNKHQTIGTGITYAKRVAYVAALNIETGEPLEDAEHAQSNKTKAPTNTAKPAVEKQWFNLTESKNSTKDHLRWSSLKAKLLDGSSKVNSIAELEQYYIVSKATKETILAWAKENNVQFSDKKQ